MAIVRALLEARRFNVAVSVITKSVHIGTYILVHSFNDILN